MAKSRHFAIDFFNEDNKKLLAGPERIELPSPGSKPGILSIELKAEYGALRRLRSSVSALPMPCNAIIL
jgi:hypothetical protein